MKKQVSGVASHLRDIILGGQDGIVNVLGVVLTVAGATDVSKWVILAGIGATIAESISMGAVAYTSTEAEQDYYKSLKRRKLLDHTPLNSATVVLIASLIGSVIPIVPFFLLPVKAAVVVALLICSVVLFVVGAAKAKLTVGTWWKAGLQLFLIGIGAALLGYFVGNAVGALL